MNLDRLTTFDRNTIAFDTETWLIVPGLLAPPLVCISWATIDDCGVFGGTDEDKRRGLEFFRAKLRDPHAIIVGANLPYDLLVLAVYAASIGIDLMPEIFAAFAAGRFYDVQTAEALHAIANGHLGLDPRTGKQLRDPVTKKPGRYSLAVVCDLVLARVNAKENDEYRQRYREFDGIPIPQWPPKARQYTIDDAVNTLDSALGQTGKRPNVTTHKFTNGPTCVRCGATATSHPDCINTRPRANLHCVADECFTSWGLHLGAAWGLRTDPEYVAALESAALQSRTRNLPEFVRYGFVREDGTEDQSAVKLAVAMAYGCSGVCKVCNGTRKVKSEKTGKPIQCKPCSATGLDLTTGPVPLTDKGSVQIGRDTLVESGNERLMDYASLGEDDKILDTYVPWLRTGDTSPITLRPNNPLDTGRVSYGDLVQLLPRAISPRLRIELHNIPIKLSPELKGLRDCIIPRPGNVFYSNDYTGGELVTFAQSCVYRVGFSKMGEALNSGVDVHSALAAELMGVTYDLFREYLNGKHGPDKKRLAKLYRQAAKPGNFGYPGGMGDPRFVAQQRAGGPDTPWPDGPSMVDDGNGGLTPGYKGLRLCLLIGGASACGVEKVTTWRKRPCIPLCKACLVCASRIKEAWLSRWTEAAPYLAWHGANAESSGVVVQHYSKRIRGGLEYCAEANGDFQALLADISKRALHRVTLEQYTRVRVEDDSSMFAGEWSPLYNVSRNIVFAHDELLGEVVEELGPEVSERINEIMVGEFRRGCPSFPRACKAEPTLMPRWYKSAECVVPDKTRPRNLTDNRLQVWRP